MTPIQGACWHEDHLNPIPRRIRERLSRPVRERSKRFNRKLSPY